MLLELTREGDYAVRAMLALASHTAPTPLSRRQIAQDWQIPAGFLAHALRKLVDGGLVIPVLGRTGGYRLARAADRITLLDVVSVVEELPSGERCVMRGGPCLPDGTCFVHETFAAARARYLEALGEHSLAAILTDAADRQAVMSSRIRRSRKPRSLSFEVSSSARR